MKIARLVLCATIIATITASTAHGVRADTSSPAAIVPDAPITCEWVSSLTVSRSTIPRTIKLDSTAACTDIVPVHVTMTSCLQRGYHFSPSGYVNVKCGTTAALDTARVVFKYICANSPNAYDFRVFSTISASDSTTAGTRTRISPGYVTVKCQ